MGEIAEMMIEGTLDCETGEYLGEGFGFPRTARSIAKGGEYAYAFQFDTGPARKFPCPHCKRKLKSEAGVKQHILVKHPDL